MDYLHSVQYTVYSTLFALRQVAHRDIATYQVLRYVINKY